MKEERITKEITSGAVQPSVAGNQNYFFSPTATSSIIQRAPISNPTGSSSALSQQLLSPITLPVVGSTPISDADFRLIMKVKYGVTTVKTGTQQEQETELTRHNLPPATIPNWQSWNPGSSSMFYNNIVQAFDAFGQSFGATPIVHSIIFYKTDYDRDPVTGVVTPNPNVGASFGINNMTIFEGLTTLNHAIPFARSINGTYANSPVSAVVTPGSSPGAPMPVPSHSESAIRMITHELGHGAQAAAMNLPDVASAPDPTMLSDYATTVGWTSFPSAHLYDMGVAAVENAFLAGTAPPAQYEITGNNWNDPRWVEQPMSHYSVSGGAGEDFAEAIMVYVTNPSLLQARSPRRYSFIHSRRGRWILNMRQTAPEPKAPGDYPLRILPPGQEYA